MAIILVVQALCLIFLKKFVIWGESRRERITFLFLAFCGFVLILGCRNALIDYPNDLNSYYRMYKYAVENSWEPLCVRYNTIERGYLLFNWICGKIWKWPQAIAFIEPIFCCGLTMRFIYKYSNDDLLSVLVFMSFGTLQFYMTGFRQSMAIAVCLLALEMARKRNAMSFVLCMLVAISFHQTAIVFFPAYIIVNLKERKSLIVLGLIVMLSLCLAVKPLVDLGNKIFEENYTLQFTGNIFGGLINMAVAFFVLLVAIYHRGTGDRIVNVSVMDGKRGTLIYLLVIGIGIYVMKYQALIVERISFYFLPTIIVLIPQAVESFFAGRDKRIMKFLLVLGMLFLIMWRYRVVEYVPFWTEV